MTILKLANAGDEATLTITGCEVVEGQFGEQVKFEAGDDILYLPRASADRQLERINLLGPGGIHSEAIGHTLHFSRTPSTKPGAKPFWNINTTKPKNGAPPVARKDEKKPVSYGAPGFLENAEAEDNAELAAKLAGVNTAKLQNDLAVYEALTDWWLSTIAPKYVKSDIGCSPESGVAGVATLFIKATR